VLFGALLTLVVAVPAGAAPTPQPYGTNDARGFRDVLPPGANGLANAVDIAAFLLGGRRPPHSDDQRDMYGDLVYAVPGLKPSDLDRFFKDATFGVKPGDVARTYNPRDDVTVVRDASYGVPHIYSSSRAGAMFALGYVAAEDRLFFIDVLRNLGRAQLASFVGGAQGNRDLDQEQWQIAPYTEQDLQSQIDAHVRYGDDGRLLRADLENYVAGINRYIFETRLNPLKMPGEYAAINQPWGPDEWKGTDIIATASLVGGIFGKGGGGELRWARLLQSLQARFGEKAGRRAWLDFRSPDDPEAPTTVRRKRFPYRTPPRTVAAGSVAVPDPGSVTPVRVVTSASGSAREDLGRVTAAAALGDHERPAGLSAKKQASAVGKLGGFPRASSNALLVSARESQTGRPLAVFGPQVSYFTPEVLMEQDVHAPTLEARGAAFPGVNLYVQLGRGRDYAWSATSAGQDIVDTFAIDLCEPGGRPPTKTSNHYVFRGECLPMEALTRTNSWFPNAADQTEAGSETLTVQRTRMGLVVARATIAGKPVAYTQLRSTYFHEVDSALGFSDFNDPAKVKSPQDFQRAAAKIGYTFNWFYADSEHIAYFNSGNNPVRAPRTDPHLPTRAAFEWRNYDPRTWTADYTPFEEHPQVVDQAWLTSWNNKQAPAYAASDTAATYTSIFRSQPLDERIEAATRGSRKMTLTDLVAAMEDAATVDLRGDKVLPWILAVLRTRGERTRRNPRPRTGAPAADLQDAVAKLADWVGSGAHRRDLDKNGAYEHSEAIRIMDAWWPLLVKAQFEPSLGGELYQELTSVDHIDNHPNWDGGHMGSAWDVGFYGHVQKDLRMVLGRRVRGPHSRIYCGGGSLARCRAALEDSLRAAIKLTPTQVYRGDPNCTDGDQPCWDSIIFRPLGAITQPRIPWVNRPTYQQVVEVQGRAPR
jgi:acyl-homoserine lactone acylase PvdQ